MTRGSTLRSYGSGRRDTRRRCRRLPGKRVGYLGEGGSGAVALRQHRLRDRPLDPDVGVVPRDPGLGARVVVARQLVGEVGDVAEHAEAVREANREEELPVAVVVELVPRPLPEGRRVAPQVDRHVPDPPPKAAHELRLPRAGLKVEPAQGAAPRARVGVLHELHVDVQLAPVAFAEALQQKAALVDVDLGLDQYEAVELRVDSPRHQPRALPYWRS